MTQGILTITGTAKVGGTITATLTDADGLYAGRDGLFDGNTIGETQYSFAGGPWTRSNTFLVGREHVGRVIYVAANYQDMSHEIAVLWSNSAVVGA